MQKWEHEKKKKKKKLRQITETWLWPIWLCENVPKSVSKKMVVESYYCEK